MQIADDYRHAFAVLNQLPCEVFCLRTPVNSRTFPQKLRQRDAAPRRIPLSILTRCTRSSDLRSGVRDEACRTEDVPSPMRRRTAVALLSSAVTACGAADPQPPPSGLVTAAERDAASHRRLLSDLVIC